MSHDTGIRLVPLTADNWRECAGLCVADDQRAFVPPNLESIAAARFYDDNTCRAVYAGGRMVGFAMYGVELPTGRVKIFRLMIAAPFQRSGHGRAAMHAMFREIRERWDGRDVYVSFHADNVAARQLYEGLGFREVERDGEKVTARRASADASPSEAISRNAT